MTESIGFIGLGNMGQPMARNILKAGFKLRVYNRNPSRAEPLVVQGAQQVSHPNEVVEPGSIVITMVANDSALESVALGENGFLEKLRPGGIHLSMSTVSPATARKLSELHEKHGSSYIAAPVFGRPQAAAAQQLWICVSGPPAAKERVQPLLNALGQGISDFGEEPGAANVVKLSGNFLIASAMEAMAEALTLAEKNGIDRSKVIELASNRRSLAEERASDLAIGGSRRMTLAECLCGIKKTTSHVLNLHGLHLISQFKSKHL
jgi:3-hydroxyisobutyrate dehydrogenase-like beta-hydroxyacid dehydrogenase